MSAAHIEYRAWFPDHENDDEYHWSTKEWEDWDSLVAENFLKYVYDNCDGWEWMPKDNGKTVVRVKSMKSNTHKDFTFVLDFDPVFTAYEKE